MHQCCTTATPRRRRMRRAARIRMVWQNPMHLNFAAVPATAPWLRHPPLRRRPRQNPMHQNARLKTVQPTAPKPSRPRRPPRTPPRRNSQQNPIHQTTPSPRPTPSHPPYPTAQRAGAGRACNGAATRPLPRAPTHDICRRGKLSVSGPPVTAPRRRASEPAQPPPPRDRQRVARHPPTGRSQPPHGNRANETNASAPLRSPDRPPSHARRQ